MKKRNLALALTTAAMSAFAVAGLCACGDDEPQADYGPDQFVYNQGINDWTKLEYPDAGMKMDGKVESSEYGEKYLSFSDVNGVNMKVYAHMGEEGVFFGFQSNDKRVYCEAEQVYNNTSIEIQVAPFGTEKLNANVIQLRLGANGYAEQWVGLRENNMQYDYTRKYIPSMGAVSINGKLNSSDCDGYSMELYLPYSSMNLSEKPESVVCTPSFNTKASAGEGPRATWTMMLGCDLSQPASWYVVDDGGMTTQTAGFEVGENGLVEQKGGSNEFYYFDSVPVEAYYLKTKLSQKEFLNNDNWPKFGLVNKSESALVPFLVDAGNRTGTDFTVVKAVQSTASGTSWLWDESIAPMSGRWANDYIKGYQNLEFETIYCEGNLYFVIDGVLVYSVKNFADPAQGAIPGLMCFNTVAAFENCVYEKDTAKVKEELAKYAPKHAAIDGDLSDWANLSIGDELNKKDANNHNELTVRAFRGDDGIYIAYQVKHETLCPLIKWSEGWWRNTNVEFFIGDKQYAMTPAGYGGYMDAIFTTVKDESGAYYNSVAEIYISNAMLEKDGFDLSEQLTAGFAFKSPSGDEGSKLNGNDWWYFGGEPTVYQYPITANGIGTGNEGGEPPIESPFTLDGDLSDWEAESIKSVTLVGAGNTSHKGAKWYASLQEDGLYLAVEAKHDAFISGKPSWYDNTNFEFFLGTDRVQRYVYFDKEDHVSASAPDIKTAMKKLSVTEGEGVAKYHTVIEVYLPASHIKNMTQEGMIRVGMAWKTAGDDIVGAGTNWGGDSWWCAYGSNPNNLEYMLYVTESGAYLKNEYLNPDMTFGKDGIAATTLAITLDGDVSEWTGIKTVGITGTDSFAGKSVKFYGSLQTTGLYLAADVTHGTYTTGKGAWHENTNFEFFVGEFSGGGPRQCYVYATETGFKASNSYIQVASTTSEAVGFHHTVVEVFIPIEHLGPDYAIQNGEIRVGMAWKTGGDEINNNAFGGNETGDWWRPAGTHPNNADMAYVGAAGISTKAEHNA